MKVILDKTAYCRCLLPLLLAAASCRCFLLRLSLGLNILSIRGDFLFINAADLLSLQPAL